MLSKEIPIEANEWGGSLAAVAWAALHRAAVVRVHDVAETVQFLDVWSAIDHEAGGA